MTSVASRLPSRSKRCVSCLMRQARPRQAPACLPLAQHRRSPSSALRCVRSAIKPSLPRWPPSWANKFALFRCVIIFLCNNVAGAAHACPSGGLFACLLICSSWMIMLGPGSSFSVPLCASMEGKYGPGTGDSTQVIVLLQRVTDCSPSAPPTSSLQLSSLQRKVAVGRIILDVNYVHTDSFLFVPL